MTHRSLANFVPLSQREKVDVSAHYSLLLAHFVPLRQVGEEERSDGGGG